MTDIILAYIFIYLFSIEIAIRFFAIPKDVKEYAI